jgi:hypothetical protein
VNLVDLIKARHAKDGVVVTECKDGPTQTRDHRRLDAWVLLKTWKPITCIGYEVKVSRSDWLQDQKFTGYFDLCHLFYVATEKGIVKDGELPEGVGLLEVLGQGSGRRLVMRKKAARRDVALPSELMAYVLMSRASIDRTFGYGPERTRDERVERWRTWLDQRQQFQEIGRCVSRRMHQIVTDALQRAGEAEERAKGLAVADRMLKEMGITPSSYEWSMRNAFERANGGVLLERLRGLQHDLGRSITQLERFRGTGTDAIAVNE